MSIRIRNLAFCAVLLVAVAVVVACGGKASPTATATGDAGANSGAPVLPNGEIATATPLPTIAAPSDVPAGMESVWQAYTILVREYVERDKVDPNKMAEGAIRGMIDALGDAHTAYISPETLKVQNSDLEGEFQGIGAEIQKAPDGKGIVIVAAIKGAPAEGAGLKPGDLILAVNGESAIDWSVLDAVNKIRGPKGSTVTLHIRKLASGQEVDVPIVRGVINQPATSYRMLEDAPYGVVVIDQFTAKVPDEVRAAIQAVKDQGAKGLILDLRGNPGGLLTAAVDVASEFLDSGLVTYEVDGLGNRRDWRVQSGGIAKEIPLVVLVDGGSASGSEVVSASLQAKCGQGRAVLIGQQTFGKGSVNTLRQLSNGGGLYLTIARWYTPNGCLIEGAGITPDVVVALPNADRTNANFVDTQMEAAIKQLNFQTGLTSAGQ